MRGSSPRMAGKNRRDTPYITDMRPQRHPDCPLPPGLCCKPGGFHIDPVRPVERAVITHGHSDTPGRAMARCWPLKRRST